MGTDTTWLDDLKEFILRKREENEALKKFQESFESFGKKKEQESTENEESTDHDSYENQPLNSKSSNINQNDPL
jgi:hypothetical protein